MRPSSAGGVRSRPSSAGGRSVSSNYNNNYNNNNDYHYGGGGGGGGGGGLGVTGYGGGFSERPRSAPRPARTVTYDAHDVGPQPAKYQETYKPLTPNLRNLRPSSAGKERPSSAGSARGGGGGVSASWDDFGHRDNNNNNNRFGDRVDDYHHYGGGGGGGGATRPMTAGGAMMATNGGGRLGGGGGGTLMRPSSARSSRNDPLRVSAPNKPVRDIFSNDNRPMTTSSTSYVGFSGERPEKQKPVPPKAGAYKVRQELLRPSLLRRFYDRGDLPISVEHRPNENVIAWKIEVSKLDYHYYLPIFFDGLRETQQPYAMFARRGILDMLEQGPGRVVAVLPQLIVPIKDALNTRKGEVVETTLKILQAMVQCDERIGECLVPYYRQLLPIFNLLKNKNKNLGDLIDYGQRQRHNIGELVNETLEMFEMYGGHDAFINIKYMVPTYESVMLAS